MAQHGPPPAHLHHLLASGQTIPSLNVPSTRQLNLQVRLHVIRNHRYIRKRKRNIDRNHFCQMTKQEPSPHPNSVDQFNPSVVRIQGCRDLEVELDSGYGPVVPRSCLRQPSTPALSTVDRTVNPRGTSSTDPQKSRARAASAAAYGRPNPIPTDLPPCHCFSSHHSRSHANHRSYRISEFAYG